MRLPALACFAVLLLAACGDYPRDPDGTLQRVRGGVMRVGVAHDPPFMLVDGGEPAGPGVELMRGFALNLGARIVWVRHGHVVLMRELEARRLEAVIGGHTEQSPWIEYVATSRPFRVAGPHGKVDRVVALPPGENAWQLAFERYAASPEARRLLGDAP